MTSSQIAASIKILISARDYKGADVQPVIDALFAQWESMNAEALVTPTAEQHCPAAAVARMG